MSFFSKKKILVTGAGGFVGANLTRKLLRLGGQLSVLVRPTTNLWRLEDLEKEISWYKGNLVNANFIKKSISEIRPDIIFHVAFPGGHAKKEKERIEMLSTGVLGTHHLLSAAHKIGTERFTHIGSSTEYGSRDTAHKESGTMNPVSIRGVGKAASTLLCKQFAAEHDFHISILRLYAVYGPWEQPIRFVPRLCHAALTGEAISLTSRGIVHDWVYVDDVVNACLKATEANTDSGEIFNIGSGIQTANEDILKYIEDAPARTAV